MSVLSDVKREAAEAVAAACEKAGYTTTPDAVLARFETPKEEFGDLACAIAFDIAKTARKAPRKIAEEVKAKLVLGGACIIEKADVAGAGYVNLHFSRGSFARRVLDSVGEGYGRSEIGKGTRAIIEFPSVNPNKPWHIGHLRNAILGDSVARLLEFSGYGVQRIDYIDDLGLQVAQSVWGFLHLSDKIDGKADHWMGKQYVEVAKRAEEPTVAEEVRELVKKLEDGNSEEAKTGRELALKCVLAQYETAFRLGIYHDALVWESDIVREKLLDKALKLALDSGAAVKETEGKNKGCIVAKLEALPEFKGMENADKVLVRSDGTAVYTGKDLAFHLWKFGLIPSPFEFGVVMKEPGGRTLYSTQAAGGAKMAFGGANLAVNVIGVEQEYPQLVLKMLLKLMGHAKEAANSVHLAYGHVALPEGRFSGRAGTWVGFTADELLDGSEKQALNEVRERFKDMGEAERGEVAKMVSVGAVRFDFLRGTPERRIIFTWEEALKFDGDTAPYIQYSHARASRILERTPGARPARADAALLRAGEEFRLVKRIASFPQAVESAARAYRPHLVAEYLLDLSREFSSFYANCPVLDAEGPLRDARLELVAAYRRTVQNGLWLLGICAPERM